MDIKLFCNKCRQSNIIEEYKFEVNDTGIYYFTCTKGHKNSITLQRENFELLFQFAAAAILDGYAREAISSIAASLERFYEFYIKVICLKHKIIYEDFERTWKLMSSQSERQYGAYLTLYMIDNKEKAKNIDNEKPKLEDISTSKTKTWKEFRNNIIHKGYIPTTYEVIEYGNIVYNHIYDLIDNLYKNSKKEFIEIQFRGYGHEKQYEKDIYYSGVNFPTIINIINYEKRPFNTLKEALDNLKNKTLVTVHI